MSTWPFPVPLDAWVGLAASAGGELPSAAGYARVEATFEFSVDGVTLSNLYTLQWPEALADWGNIIEAPVYDAQTGGNLLFTIFFGTLTGFGLGGFGVGYYGAAIVPLDVPQYARARIQAGNVQAILGAASLPRGFGTGRFGRYAYGTLPSIAASGTLELTFPTSDQCQPGTWTPFKCAA